MNFYKFLMICVELYDTNFKKYVAYARFIFLKGVLVRNSTRHSLELLKLKINEKPL